MSLVVMTPKSNVMSVNYRDGSITHKSFTTEEHFNCAVASRNESIFIVGGNLHGMLFSTCEKLDSDSGRYG